MPTTSVAQYQRAIQIVEEIARLEEELRRVLGGEASAPTGASGSAGSGSAPARRPGRPKGSGQKSAGSKSSAPKGSGRKRRTMSPEARARIAAAQRQRWAKARGGK